MGFASCKWPVWRSDDFTQCFQQEYLRVLIPLTVIGLSVSILAFDNIRRGVKIKRIKRIKAYKPISADHAGRNPAANRRDLVPHDDESSEGGDECVNIHGGRVALAKTTPRGSIVQADNPPAQTLSMVVEELAIGGLVVVNAIALATETHGSGRHVAAIAGLVVWIYVLLLATLRLILGSTQWRVPKIWSHTAAIYALQWLFSLVFFRSVLVRPSSSSARGSAIVEFTLTSVLFVMALTTRRGNKTILLEWEDGIEPSREPLVSLFSHYTFSWVDSIVWQGYKAPLELKNVWNLLPRDKANVVLAHYRLATKTTVLTLHLLKYFRGPLLAQALWAAVSGVFTFAPTLLLKAILEYVEDPSQAPQNVLWLYVMLLPVTDIIRSVCDNQALWIGRKICINIRAILIGEIYAKALRRKAAAGKEATLGKHKRGAKEGVLARMKRLLSLQKQEKDRQRAANDSGRGPRAHDKDEADEQTNMGTIINLMSVDSFKVSEVTAYLHFLVAAAPTQLLVSVFLLYRVMGLSAIPGFIVMTLLLPINIGIAKGFNSSQKKIMSATDKRIQTTNEILQNIRIIKYFAWERRFSDLVNEKRDAELQALRGRYMIWATAVCIWNTVPVTITFFSFFAYTKLEGKPLYPSVAFTAISLFMLLRHPLDALGDMIAHVQESRVSIERIEEFLSEGETDKFEQLGQDNVDDDGNKLIGFRNAAFIWGGKKVVAEDGSMAFRLLDLNLDFKLGKLNVITGPTGSGKSSLLMALLGEMTLIGGRVFLPGGRSREDVRADPETGLAETCAYVAQQTWLVNASIKDNILFAAAYQPKRYKDVVVACALERDLQILHKGDQTLVGEKGISLSGGQKQRISLARAVYSNSKHVLLDDCLSAVDSHTAKWIMDNCILGPLMRHRTCILVSHNMPLCLPSSDFVVVMNNGRVTAQGRPEALISAGKFGDDVLPKSQPGSAPMSCVPSRVPSSLGEESGDTLVGSGAESEDHVSRRPSDTKTPHPSDTIEEAKAVGAVKWPVMKLYLGSMGPWWFWVVAVLVFGLQQLSGVASNLWIKEWASQYSPAAGVQVAIHQATYASQPHSPSFFAMFTAYATQRVGTLAHPPPVDATFYLAVLALIGVAGSMTALVRDLWLFFGSLTASWKLHDRLMSKVSGAKFKFFELTPLGQMMNRFSKDLEAVDQEVAPIAIGVMSCSLAILITIALIAATTPMFLVFGCFITLAYYYLGQFYLHSSRDLKRLESVQRSPLFQQFSETLSGVTTIRAYGDERRFVRDNLTKINQQSRPFIYLWAANRWLAFRTDFLGDTVAFCAGLIVVLSLGKIDAGSAGISLSYAVGFADNMLWLVRLYAMNEQNMNAVDRIKEYLDVEQEAAQVVEKNRPARNWPANGSVEFINYTARYRDDLDPVLRNLTFKLEARQKIGIVGRTGAGKSSLALAILRALEAESGSILIDGVDIGLIGLRDLREGITIVPQEPTLFSGTIRTNLDPFDAHKDEDIFVALRRVQLIGPDESTTPPTTPLVPHTPLIHVLDRHTDAETRPTTPAANKNAFRDLSSPVSESGNNLSQGQRQLLCLARALLKKPTVLVMDEATASIDYATDSKVQKTIRELTSTIITIAHRLQTIVDYDKVLVLDKGRLIEYGHPWELMQNKDGLFRSMCDTSGDYLVLAKAAKKAYTSHVSDANLLLDIAEEHVDATEPGPPGSAADADAEAASTMANVPAENGAAANTSMNADHSGAQP